MNPWLAMGQAIWGIIKPFVAPVIAYFKGRSDAKKNERLKADEEFIDRVDAGKRAADNAQKLPVDLDPNNRDQWEKS